MRWGFDNTRFCYLVLTLLTYVGHRARSVATSALADRRPYRSSSRRRPCRLFYAEIFAAVTIRFFFRLFRSRIALRPVVFAAGRLQDFSHFTARRRSNLAPMCTRGRLLVSPTCGVNIHRHSLFQFFFATRSCAHSLTNLAQSRYYFEIHARSRTNANSACST